MELKKKVFSQIDKIIDGSTIVASSSSCLPSSSFTENLKNRNNMLVAHPVSTLFNGGLKIFQNGEIKTGLGSKDCLKLSWARGQNYR